MAPSLLVVFVSIVAVASAQNYDKCSFARKLIDLKVPSQDVHMLTCIAEEISGFNLTRRNGLEWGLYGLYDDFWCDSSGKPLTGHCKMSCEDMTKSVDNAITCMKVLKQLYGGYHGFVNASDNCQKKASTYLKDCSLTTDAPERIYDKCNFARKLIDLKVPIQDVPTLTCISENITGFNDAYREGVAWGLFGLHDEVWCDSSGRPLNGHCKMSCEDMTRSVENAVTCVKAVKQRYGRYNGWLGVGESCQARASTYLNDCPVGCTSESTSVSTGKQYDKCSFAQKLLNLDVPLDDIPKLTCIAEKMSGFRDIHVDGYARGIFGINVDVWCDDDGKPLNATCRVSCKELMASTASSVACARIVMQVQGYRAWAGVGVECLESAFTYLDDCKTGSVYRPDSRGIIERREIYDKCAFAKKLLELDVPFEEIPKLTCVAEITGYDNGFQNSPAWGIFGLNDNVWCDEEGKSINSSCRVTCQELSRSTAVSVACAMMLVRVQGYAAWGSQGLKCQAKTIDYLKDCPQGCTTRRNTGMGYDKCGFAKKLQGLDVPIEDIPTLTCIAEKTSGFRDIHHNGPAWGIFGLHENVWCDRSSQPLKADCKMTCEEMTTATSSAVACVQIVKRQYLTYNGWGGVGQTCQALAPTYLNECPMGCTSDKKAVSQPRVYDKCSLAQKLLDLDVPLEDIPILTCIAEKVSGMRDDHHVGPAWGLFGLYDGVWCDTAGKPLNSTCYMRCEELATSTASSVACVMMLKRVQGYVAWPTSGPECLASASTYLSGCKIGTAYRPHAKKVSVGRKYDKCDFAKKLLDLDVPQDDIPILTCMAEDKSQLYDGFIGDRAWGVFGINEGIWCNREITSSNNTCKFRCDELTRSTADSVACARIMKRVQGDWGLSSRKCEANASTYLDECSAGCSRKKSNSKRYYSRCEFAQKLLDMDVPLDDVPKLTCVAEKITGLDSGFNSTFSFGIFGLYGGYWCDVEGKPLNSSCRIRCEELVKSTASSIECVKMLLRVQGYVAWGSIGSSCLETASTYLNECSISKFAKQSTSIPAVVPVTPVTTPSSASSVKETCVVPEPPDAGRYVRFRGWPGDNVPTHSVLEVRCRRNYTLVGNKYTKCLEDGSWEQLPECKRKCQLLVSRTTNVTCTQNDVQVNCGGLLDHGTIVSPICKPGHVNNNLVKNKCDDGWWRFAFQKCKSICGETPGIGVGLVINGTIAPRGLFPWHAIIYKISADDPSGYAQICGGTIVSNHFVVSAAHCFYNDVKKGVSPSADNYLVGLGKHKRSAGDELDNPWVQNIEVKQILLPVAYKGDARNQQSDIALLLLEIEIEFTQYVLPICMSYDKSAERSFLLKKNPLARVPGTGLQFEDGDASKELRYLDVPVVDRYTCEREMPESFQKYLTNDKICAGYMNGSSVCTGDSGGGLIFQSNVHEKTKWYLLGVVSTGVPSETFGTSSCKSNTYSSFTRMTDHAEWIEQNDESLGQPCNNACSINTPVLASMLSAVAMFALQVENLSEP